MIASYAPQIARVAEETVLNLKELESRIEVLKNDLAVLCTSIGHPEAARIAATPARWLGIGDVRAHPGVASPLAAQTFGSLNPFATLSPFGSVSPYGAATPFGVQSPYGVSPYGAATPFTAGPFAANPLATPFGSATPYATPFATPFASPSFSAFR